MRIHLIFIAACLLTTTVQAQTPSDSKPQNPELRQELLRRMDEDQEVRQQFISFMQKQKTTELAKLSPADLSVLTKLQETDKQNTTRLKEIVEQHGWPGKKLVGTDGAHAAWLLLQHADQDPAFQKRCLPLLETAVKEGEATAQDFAYLTDRVLIAEKKKQLYGTQLMEVGGNLTPLPIEDEEHVDDRRKKIGLMPMAEYLKLAADASTGKASFK